MKRKTGDLTGDPSNTSSRYTRAELIENARAIFGVMPEAVVGAFDGSDREEWTKAEAEEAIGLFLQKGVEF